MKSLRCLLAILALLATQAASAMATIEFMKLNNLEQYHVVQPIMVSFLQRGYKKIPDNEFTLIEAIRKLAYAKGYTYQNVETVAEEAAITLGMTR